MFTVSDEAFLKLLLLKYWDTWLEINRLSSNNWRSQRHDDKKLDLTKSPKFSATKSAKKGESPGYKGWSPDIVRTLFHLFITPLSKTKLDASKGNAKFFNTSKDIIDLCYQTVVLPMGLDFLCAGV